MQSFGFIVARVDVTESLSVGVTDDIAAGDLVGAAALEMAVVPIGRNERFTAGSGQRAIPDSMGFACRGRRCRTEWSGTDHSWCNGKRVNRPLGSWNTTDNWSAIARKPPAFRQAAHQRSGKAKGLASAWKPLIRAVTASDILRSQPPPQS
jgi:hypothetical protein